MGIELGQQPVEAFIQRNYKELFPDGTYDEEIRAAKKGVKKLARLYQITPSNEALKVLLDHHFDSAQDVTALPMDEFLDSYGTSFSTAEEARHVYKKAQQVSIVIYNFYTTTKLLESTPPVPAMSPSSPEAKENFKNELIKQYPTMEFLFGSLDFCECEHCRSVLSPAAYLVDLLQFLDPNDIVWKNILGTWQLNHHGERYQDDWSYDNIGEEYPDQRKKPYYALIEKRPDIPHIPLTCENTNTALPYIDIVNEILEYYVANGKLGGKAAYDTGEATTAELLAEPQNVIREAYDKLQEARYPLNLPFDLWIETVRQFCNYFETPLAQVLEVFRASDDDDDDLFAPAKQPFDRASIFIESLGLSPAEFAIFSDPDPLKLGKWYELFGYPRAKIDGAANDATNATVNVPNSTADLFKVEDWCAYYDGATGILQNEEDKIKISKIGGKDSGGQGKTMITFDGIWQTAAPPKAGDILVLADVPKLLSSAKTLSRRLGVTYKEMVQIVQTGFVNPKLAELAILYKLGVTIHDVLFYRGHKPLYEQNKDLLGKKRSSLSVDDQGRFDKLSDKNPETMKTGWESLNEVDAFERQLNDMSETFKPYNFNASAWLNTTLQNDALAFDDILLLDDPNTGCNFDLTTLRYASGRAADDIAFLRINLFVRLWRKLGWTIEETDHALQVFVPKNAPFDKGNLNKQPLKTALIYFAHLKALDQKMRVGNDSRLKIITLWSYIATKGKNPLYAQLFLTRSMLKSDDVFDHPLGQYLSAGGIAAMAQSRKHEVELEKVSPQDKIDQALFASEPKVGVWYDELQEVQHLAFEGVMTDAEKAALKALSSSSPVLDTLLDAVQVKGKEFALVKGHLLGLQGALGLTANEIGRILEDAAKSIDTAELSLPNVSLLYRYGLLAKMLKLSVQELIALKKLSDIDPFKLLQAEPVKTLKEDYPFSLTLRFVEMAEQVKESGLKIEDLEYLLLHRFDKTGKYRPNQESTLVLLKKLVEGVRAIRAEHTIPDDPGSMSEDMLRQKLGLGLPPDAVERFLTMINGTVEFTATKTGVAANDKLKPEDFTNEPAVDEVRYDSTRQEQKLTVRIFDPHRPGLEARHPSTVFADLMEDIQTQARDFFDNHLKKQKLRLDGEAGFLDDGDFITLFDPLKPLVDILPSDTPQEIEDKQKENEKITNDNQTELQERQYRVAQAFFPYLQERLIRQFIVQTMIAQTAAADPKLVESLLTDARLLSVAQLEEDTTRPLLDILAATAEAGITATFFASTDGTGETLGKPISFADANTGLKDSNGNPLKPAGTNSARLEGYLEVPTPGAYRFFVTLAKQNAEAELRFAHLAKPTLTGTANNDGDELGDGPDEYVELKPGIPYRFRLDLRKLNGGEAQMLVQGETLPKDTLAQLPLYPLTAIEAAEHAIGLLNKTLQLLQTLLLSEREARYLLTHAHDFDELNLSNLPTRESEETPAPNNTVAKELFTQFLRLAGYSSLKRDLAGGTDDLIGIFEANEVADMDKVYSLIAKLTRRNETTIKATSKALFFTAPSFPSEKPLQRLWEALQVIERFGVPVASLVKWTRIVRPPPPPPAPITVSKSEQRFEIARDLKESIKARFEPETWQRIAQPIFDKLRQRKRDSLVAYIMHKERFERIEELFEYFLIDPGMEPVVQTSRIRLAISSAQLFIQRSLLNLEKRVSPSAINSQHWQWMKRYRVWEANRKIFLFPENWLEPEFRDDKTHIFQELESALLQGDVSNDLAEDAFFNYLKNLEELATLDIVTTYLEEKSDDPASNTLHVIGRTSNSVRQYFYRQYAHHMWTPWEPVTAEIGSSDHVVAVVWRERLHLFWLTFLDKTKEDLTFKNKDGKIIEDCSYEQAATESKITDAAAKKQVEIQLNWIQYFQGQWTAPEAAGIGKPILVVDKNLEKNKVFIFASLKREDESLLINLSGDIKRAFRIRSKNESPKEANVKLPKDVPYSVTQEEGSPTKYASSGEFKVSFVQQIETIDDKVSSPSAPVQEKIIQAIDPDNSFILPCTMPQTLIDDIISFLNWLHGFLSTKPLDDDAIIKRVSDFTNSLRLRLSNESSSAANEISEEWNVIRDDIVNELVKSGLSPYLIQFGLINGFMDELEQVAADGTIAHVATADIKRYTNPFFYQDNAHCFFVEPTLFVTTIVEYNDYAINNQPDKEIMHFDELDDIYVEANIPSQMPLPPDLNAVASFEYKTKKKDWLTDSSTILVFDDTLIWQDGGLDSKILPFTDDNMSNSESLVEINPGSELAVGSAVAARTVFKSDSRRVSLPSDGLNVVGNSGITSVLLRQLNRKLEGGGGGGGI